MAKQPTDAQPPCTMTSEPRAGVRAVEGVGKAQVERAVPAACRIERLGVHRVEALGRLAHRPPRAWDRAGRTSGRWDRRRSAGSGRRGFIHSSSSNSRLKMRTKTGAPSSRPAPPAGRAGLQIGSAGERLAAGRGPAVRLSADCVLLDRGETCGQNMMAATAATATSTPSPTSVPACGPATVYWGEVAATAAGHPACRAERRPEGPTGRLPASASRSDARRLRIFCPGTTMRCSAICSPGLGLNGATGRVRSAGRRLPDETVAFAGA